MRIRSLIAKGCAVIACAASIWGCNKANSNAPALDASGKHPATWYVDHRAAYMTNPNQCPQCHGSDLKGGISKVSCSSDSFNGLPCHTSFPPSGTHPQGWRDPLQHGAKAKAQPGIFSGFASCQICHGVDFTGGIAAVSCFTPSRNGFSCHGVNAPHSPAPWLTSPSPTHTSTVNDMAGSNPAVCALCHLGNRTPPQYQPLPAGTQAGCFNSTLCHGVPASGAGHSLPYAQPSLHGGAAMANLLFCQSCHANPSTGAAGSNPRFNVPLGRLVNGCEDCHAPFAAHPPVLQIPAVFGNISTFNTLGTKWYLHCETSPSGFDGCKLCHGATLGGGPNGAVACTSCHKNRVPTTLLDCASCHGNPPDGTAYPNIAASHTTHNSGALTVPLACGECHQGLGSVTLDHFNRATNWSNGTASVQAGPVGFGALAFSNGASPAYNETTKQCTNTYCHGATITGGANKSPIWGQTNYLSAGCGTCHGYPPPSPHTTSTSCSGCHPDVNATNNGFKDASRHVNGFLNVSTAGGVVGAAHAFPYPGSLHNSPAGAAPFSACIACHTNNSANRGGYPTMPLPTPPNPPDCQGCHTKSGPIGNPTTGCYSCHGSSTNGGRPNGSSFPDIAGGHNNNHGGFGCSTCHGTAGTGQASHGSSNGVAHTGALPFAVVVSLPSSGNTIAFSPTTVGHGTCTGTCNGQGHNPKSW